MGGNRSRVKDEEQNRLKEYMQERKTRERRKQKEIKKKRTETT